MAEHSPDHLPFFKFGNVAVGFIAVGNVAYGFVAIGVSIAIGPIAIGLNAVGPILALGLNTIGLLSLAAINAGGLVGFAGVNLVAGFGAAGVNNGVSPIAGIVYGILSIVASRFFPKGASVVERPAGVPEERFTLEALLAGTPRRGWVEARLEAVEPARIHVRQGSRRASLLVSGDAERFVVELAARPGILPCKACFHVEMTDDPLAPTDADYRRGPAYQRNLRCHQVVVLPPRPAWWARKSMLHGANRAGAIVGGVISIAAGIAGLLLL